MGSLNNGIPIIQQSGVLIARHLGHVISISNYTTDGNYAKYRLTLDAPVVTPAPSGASPITNPLSFDGIVFWLDFGDDTTTTIVDV